MLFYCSFKKWDFSNSLWCDGNENETFILCLWITEAFHQLTCCCRQASQGAFLKLQIKQQAASFETAGLYLCSLKTGPYGHHFSAVQGTHGTPDPLILNSLSLGLYFIFVLYLLHYNLEAVIYSSVKSVSQRHWLSELGVRPVAQSVLGLGFVPTNKCPCKMWL